MDQIRVGKVSSVNHDEGKIRVVYSDRDDCTTVELPMVVYNNTYRMPKVDDQVLVMHQPNGAASGFVIGDYWSKTHKTHKEGGEGQTVQYFDRDGKCYIQYSDSDEGGGDGGFQFHNDNALKVETKEDIEAKSDQTVKIEGADSVKVNSDGSIEIKTSGAITIQGATVDINGVLTINGMPYLAHTHGNGNGGSPTTGVIST